MAHKIASFNVSALNDSYGFELGVFSNVEPHVYRWKESDVKHVWTNQGINVLDIFIRDFIPLHDPLLYISSSRLIFTSSMPLPIG